MHIPIPHERQHVSDFGRTLSFDGTLVRIETECGLIGWGEAKAQVGGMAQNQALTCMINDEFAPLLMGEDPRDITRLWETLYSGTRGHYALREGRVFPVLGRRGITVSAISGVDCALWDILGKSLGAAGVAAARRPAGRADAGLRLGRLGRRRQDRRAAAGLCRGRRVRRGQDAGRHHRRRPAPFGTPRAGGARGAGAGGRADVRRARHVVGGRGEALLPPRRGLQPRLVRGAGDGRRQTRPGAGARRHRHPDRLRRERVHPPRFPRPRGVAGGRHHAARPGDLRRHHRGDAHLGASPAPST